MKNLTFYYILPFLLIALSSCDKKKNEIAPEPVIKKTATSDSISFSMGGQLYAFGQRYKAGTGNSPVNIKSSSTKTSENKLAYETGGLYWYGTPDSTLYAINYGFASKPSGNNLSVYFTKKYKDSELKKGAVLLHPESNSDLLRKTKLPFAVDYGKENTMDGVIIELYDRGKLLSTTIPGFSILVRSKLKNDIQNNSSFEIIKVEHLQDDRFLIEAKFDANLFDEEEKLYRITNGFIRFSTNMNPSNEGLIGF